MPRSLRRMITVSALAVMPGLALAQADPVSQSALPPAVDSQPLSAPNVGAAGLLSSATTGLPNDLWTGSDPRSIATLIAAVDLPVPAMTRMMQTLILAEAQPPRGDMRHDFLDSRLTWLTSQGAVEQAVALLDITGVDDPRLFAHWVNLSLLLGQTEPVCAKLDAEPRLSSDLSLRIFCAARSGDWQRAALILQSAETLGEITGRHAELMVRFLDPEAGNGRDLLPPVRPSALEFRLFEALGEPLPTAPLPRSFAVLDLSGDNGWRAQIEAAERLARAGSLPPNRLLGLYSLRDAAASGGVWDRVDALQNFEAALQRDNDDLIGRALVQVWPQMAHARLLSPFAEMFAVELEGRTFEGRAARMARRLMFLSSGYEELTADMKDTSAEAQFLTEVARGLPPQNVPALPHAEAVALGFRGVEVPSVLRDQLAEGRLGEVVLRAMALFASGADGNGQDLSDAISTFRAVGLEDVARRASLELMILDAERALQ
ncbi:hypothetical protein GGQ68_001350 [Sagittula marina]|uniref:Uncharacterized protein n=2 Tax=Sagittula marina TaxID=943940 RepID=A0A7W6GR45_9RHOB|nr:hypothetical protein [Sagittula marina]MBB3985021.1 hypothetical protein [Sagittula marina]